METDRRRGKRQTGGATVAAAMAGRDLLEDAMRAEVREVGTGRAASTSRAPLTTAAPEGRKVEKGDGSPEAGGVGEAAIGEAAAIEAAVEAAAAGTRTAGSTSRSFRQGTMLKLLTPTLNLGSKKKNIIEKWDKSKKI